WWAVLLLGLGETEPALDRLEQATDERFDWIVALRVEPLFDELRAHPRFVALIERIGLTIPE
ncbi:MAG: TPR end-of-group domain-containing protein, partial [Myxococcota bacterium]